MSSSEALHTNRVTGSKDYRVAECQTGLSRWIELGEYLGTYCAVFE